MEIARYFEQTFLESRSSDQREGLQGTIANYLRYYLTPSVAEVISSSKPNTFEFADLDRGRIICLSMPQDFQMERRYVSTIFKLLFYQHVLRRFDDPVRMGFGARICWVGR